MKATEFPKYVDKVVIDVEPCPCSSSVTGGNNYTSAYKVLISAILSFYEND